MVTNNLNVRTGPGLGFFVLGQLNDGDQVPIVGRLRDGDDAWLAIPGVGWVFDNPEWLDLDRDAVRDVPDGGRVLSAVAPPHPADVRTGIGTIDEVIEAVLSGDLDTVMAQVRLTTFECRLQLGLDERVQVLETGWGRLTTGVPPKCALGESDYTRVEVWRYCPRWPVIPASRGLSRSKERWRDGLRPLSRARFPRR